MQHATCWLRFAYHISYHIISYNDHGSITKGNSIHFVCFSLVVMHRNVQFVIMAWHGRNRNAHQCVRLVRQCQCGVASQRARQLPNAYRTQNTNVTGENCNLFGIHFHLLCVRRCARASYVIHDWADEPRSMYKPAIEHKRNKSVFAMVFDWECSRYIWRSCVCLPFDVVCTLYSDAKAASTAAAAQAQLYSHRLFYSVQRVKTINRIRL